MVGPRGHVDVPRLIEGGIGAQFFGLVSLPVGQRAGLAAVIDEQIDELDRQTHAHPEKLTLVRTAADIDAARACGSMSALLGIEGRTRSRATSRSWPTSPAAACATSASATSAPTRLASPPTAAAAATPTVLTAFGREVVRRCESLEVIVDLSHINRKGFLEACAMATRPRS